MQLRLKCEAKNYQKGQGDCGVPEPLHEGHEEPEADEEHGLNVDDH